MTNMRYVHMCPSFSSRMMWRHLVIMIFGLSLLLLLELVSNCFKVVPMLVLVGVRLALFDEIPGRLK